MQCRPKFLRCGGRRVLPELGRAGCLERARRAWGGPGIRAAVHGRRGAAPPHPLKERQHFQEHRLPPERGSTKRTPGAPPGPPEGAAMGHGRGGAPGGGNFAAICGTSGSGARQNAAPARTGRDPLPLFAALAPPGPGKPALPLQREANPTGFAGKWHGSVRYFRSEAPCF